MSGRRYCPFVITNSEAALTDDVLDTGTTTVTAGAECVWAALALPRGALLSGETVSGVYFGAIVTGEPNGNGLLITNRLRSPLSSGLPHAATNGAPRLRTTVMPNARPGLAGHRSVARSLPAMER